MSSVKDDMKLL